MEVDMINYSCYLMIDGNPTDIERLDRALVATIAGSKVLTKKLVEGQLQSAYTVWLSQPVQVEDPETAESSLQDLLFRLTTLLAAQPRGDVRVTAQVVVRADDQHARGFFFSASTVHAASKCGAALEAEHD
jgi:hypothetical protein